MISEYCLRWILWLVRGEKRKLMSNQDVIMNLTEGQSDWTSFNIRILMNTLEISESNLSEAKYFWRPKMDQYTNITKYVKFDQGIYD